MPTKINVQSPIDDGLVGELPVMSKADIDGILKKLTAAQPDWAARPLKERAVLVSRLAKTLTDNADELADLLVREVGKTPADATDEIVRTAELISATVVESTKMKPETLRGEDFPGWKAKDRQTVSWVPWGVVLAIAPYNYPVNLSLSKIAPALLMGNTVVFKPPTQGAVTGRRMVELLHETGLPSDLLEVITGKTAEIGDWLVTHQAVKQISMTGSTAVGQRIAERTALVPLLLELGGNDPAIVLDDADFELAAQEVAHGAFKYAGQRCTAVKRVYVIDDVADKFVDRLVEQTKEHFGSTGDPREHPVGPLISGRQADYVEALLTEATKSGGKAVIGGKRDGRYIEATVVDEVPVDCRLVIEEQFGPVLPIVRVADTDEAVRLANDTSFGLQASVFTGSKKLADQLAERLEVGGVHVNGPDQRGPDNFLFVGHKRSGFGPQGVRFALEGMGQLKGVVHRQ